MKYVYPAVFSQEEGAYNVTFPDLEGCVTFGEGMADAIKMAEDALCLYLYSCEEDKIDIPVPSEMEHVKREDGETVSLIACDTLEYRKYFGSHSVRKTVTVPAWLNTLAEQADLSFSAILQQGLKAQLHLDGN